MKRNYIHSIASAALLLFSGTASAHIGYTARDFGVVVPNAAPVTIVNQTVTGNYGWADGTDADNADSHKVRYYRFNLAAPAYVTVSFSGSTNSTSTTPRNGSIKPGFSIYQGLAHLPPLTTAPGSADYDTSAISMAYRATLGYPVEGCFHALKDWRIGGENQHGPTFDFDAPNGLSTFVFKGYAADGDSSLFGVVPGVTGDGNADGTVTKSFFLPAGDYTIAAGGVNYGGQLPTPDATVYGLTGTISASAFTYVAGDPVAGGIGYGHQVTLGKNSSGSFSGHVGAWSWEDNSLFDAVLGEAPVGWTHTSNWAAVSVQSDTVLTITMERDASVPWAAAPEGLNGLADTASMFPSFSLFRGLDNDGDDFHTYNNRGNVDWAEDIQYVDHLDNSTEFSVTRSYFLRAGDYTLALGSNAPANNTNRQGYKINFSTKSNGAADPVPNTYLPPDYIGTGGVGYAFTVVAGADETGSFKSHVGAWSWEDNALFGNPGQSPQPVGWTHTSNWVAVKLTQEVFFSLTLERDATVPWPSTEDANRLADTTSMFPSLSLYRGWDNDGSDNHTYNNRGNVAWAEDIRYVDHVDNSAEETVTRTWRLPAGEYSFALGSNAASNNPNRQGYKATYSTRAASNILAADPASGGIGYAHVISVGRGDSGSFSNHVGAWSWEDNDLFDANAGEAPVGWTHTSRWAAVHVKDHITLNITMARDANVPWESDIEALNDKADTSSMYPSFTLWRGWDNDVAPLEFRARQEIIDAWQPFGGVPADLGDHHTYNNRGNVVWAEDLSYIDHCDNSSATTITRSYTLAPGYYSFALGSNSTSNNDNRQGFSFAWTTGAPALIAPIITLQPKGAEILVTRSASLSVTATGPGLSYQWFFKGKPIENATAAKLNITNADLTKAGAYTCTVRNSAGWVHSNPAVLVVIAKPVVAPFDIPNLIVGQPYQIQPAASNNPVSYAIKGLPKGLVFNTKTGLISGRPTEIKALCTVEVIATNKAGPSAQVTDTFAVNGLAPGTGGSFVGPLGRASGINGLLGGCVKLQVSSLGSLSGTITLGKTAPYRISEVLDTSIAAPSAHFHIKRVGQPEIEVTFVIDPISKSMMGEITDGITVLPFIARQPLTPLGTNPGDYTFALPLDPLDVGDQTIPQGHSVGAFKIATTGTATGVVVTADNNRITFGGVLEQQAKLTLFSLLYKGAGSVLGQFSIDAATGDLATSEVSWFKDVVAKDLVYGAGFGPVELTTVGRKYTTPALTGLALGTAPGAGNAKISFAEGGAPTPATRLDTDKLQIELTKVTVATPNPGKVALSIDKGKPGLFTAGTSGSFKGSFELTDSDTSVTPTKPLVRKSEFQGMMVDNGTEVKGYGFFLLSKMPTASPKTTLATSPRLSGSVLLEKVTVAE
ncbi:MAG: putative Ig domain-containing protein [Verrucomicrobia bacterium]|nr:putative Ig domain-containing protein [Verrucomicrobiota bacterium]